MLTLLNAGLLPWIAAVGIPVAIHLLTRKTRRQMDLPTVRFLQRTLARQSSLFRWRHLILLALRTLAVLALALAFTKPALNSALALPAQEHAGVVLVLDVSESMSYSAGGLTSLAKAKGEALKVLRGLRPGDRANLVLCGAQPSAAASEPVADLAAVEAAVRDAQATEERGDAAAALNLAVEQLTKSNARVRRLYLLSDFQRTAWADVKFESVPADTQVLFVNSDSFERDNAGLTALRLRPTSPRVGETVSLECEVFNSGRALKPIPVTLALSNGARYTQTVTAGPYSSAAASFPVRFDTPQRIECTATLPPDHLAADDRRHAVLDLRRAATVLLLTDEDASAPPAASFFLARALHPDPAAAGGFRIIPTKPAALNNPLLQSADAVVVCNAPSMPEVQFQALAKYATGGGNLVWLLYGDRIKEQVASLSRQLPASEPAPFQVEDVADLAGNGKGYVTLAEARYESPLLRAFKDPAAADLSRVRVRRFCITTEVDPRAEVLLKYDDGTAAAVRTGEGSGNLLLLNLAPSPAWSDLARQEAFLPLVHELLKGVLNRDTGDREFSPGGSASVMLPPAAGGGGTKVTCTGPDGAPVPVAADATTGAVIVDRARRAGFYRIQAGGQAAASIPVSAHPDETDLRSLDPRELGTRRQKESAYLTGTATREADVADLNKGTPLWHYLFLAALALLFAEQWVARVGPRRRA